MKHHSTVILSLSFLLILTTALLWGSNSGDSWTFRPISQDDILLSEVVNDFNGGMSFIPQATNQPSITVDEVIATIRALDHRQIADETYKVLQQIAKNRKLHAKATFRIQTSFNRNGYHIDVLRITLDIPVCEPYEEHEDYGWWQLVVRERRLASRPLTEKELRRELEGMNILR